MILPIKSKNPPESVPYATIALIAINVIVYACTTNGFEIHEEVLRQWGLTGNNFGLLHMTSSMFLHANLLHLIGNMWFLYLFGFAVEGRMRTIKYVILYFAAGYAGDLLHQLILGSMHPDLPSLGASGAIMGVLGAALYAFPHGKILIFYRFFVWGTTDWPMWGVASVYIGLDVLEAAIYAGKDGVGHFAHIGGAITGLLVCALFRTSRDDALASEAKATFSDTKDLRTLTRSELASLHRANPQDTCVVLNWMHRSLKDPSGVSPECNAAFFGLLPQIVANEPIQSVGSAVAYMAMNPGVVPPRVLLDCGSRLERAHDNVTALRMYEAVLRDPAATESDLEAALYRGGMLSEAVFQQYDRALSAYGEIVRRWPMSPMAEQARARMKVLQGRPQTPAI